MSARAKFTKNRLRVLVGRSVTAVGLWAKRSRLKTSRKRTRELRADRTQCWLAITRLNFAVCCPNGAAFHETNILLLLLLAGVQVG